ncbi:MAG: 4-alpha-glucanotransferase, partial [Verrucomicrobiae bacterium]|nr:4-alpha-glucanotransferase [Verrucomicrobiae bacterium]
YLDLPVGVNHDGYDVWKEKNLYALDAAAGAPPDALFTSGQNWGFPPLHPAALRAQGYRHFIAYLRNHLRFAGVLRIDHLMMLHRLFWIPKGMEAKDGVYVKYRPEEYYAILALESQRARSLLIGENLGTVPPEVTPAMERHAIQQMYVVEYEAANPHLTGLRAPPANSVASLNTHDMFPIASFWEGHDVPYREKLGLIRGDDVARERGESERRRGVLTDFLRRDGWLKGEAWGTREILKALLAFLAASPARLVIVNLEDLWLELNPQNVPGTWREHPNWKRRLRLSLEQFAGDAAVIEALKLVDSRRPGRSDEPTRPAELEAASP